MRWLLDRGVDVVTAWTAGVHAGYLWMWRPLPSICKVNGTGVTGPIGNAFGNSSPMRRLSAVTEKVLQDQS